MLLIDSAVYNKDEVAELVKKRESAEVVKDRILKVATELFAKHGVDGVGIRRIAEEAGISHALIIRYFGNKNGLMAEILRLEVAKLSISYPVTPGLAAEKTLANIRRIFLDTISSDENTMRLIVRSGLDGLRPESYVDENHNRAAGVIAKWIESKRTEENLPDARLVSLILIGAMFSLVCMAPWLMTSVGFSPDDFEKRREDIIDVVLWFLARSVGLPPGADAKR
ncbi:MAG TPA: helix-turn-helix domain-containing protein [Clostridia bacterium]|nr:helix-turn-helix domain-containing protein [Clostridia bacterium]